jgi:tryptophan synthase alpha chain
VSRIKTVFDKLKSENKKALITFVTAGDPSIEATEQIIYQKQKPELILSN